MSTIIDNALARLDDSQRAVKDAFLEVLREAECADREFRAIRDNTQRIREEIYELTKERDNLKQQVVNLTTALDVATAQVTP